MLLALLLSGSLAPVVIAAPNGIDQSARDGGSFPLDVVPIVLGVLAAAAVVWRRWSRLADLPPRPVVFRPEHALLLLAAIFLAGAFGVAAAQRLWNIKTPEDLRAMALLQVGSSMAQMLVVGIYAVLVAAATAHEERRPRRLRAALLGAACIAVSWPIAALVGTMAGWLQYELTGVGPQRIAHELLRMLVEDPRSGWSGLLAVLVVLPAPIIEEVTYRGLLQELLRRIGLGPWTAIVITSAIFAARHIPVAAPYAVVALFVLSLGFGWAYERTGRLTAPIVMHCAFNAGNLVLAMVLGA
jgi:CAAX protease family protein